VEDLPALESRFRFRRPALGTSPFVQDPSCFGRLCGEEPLQPRCVPSCSSSRAMPRKPRRSTGSFLSCRAV
jgi:hypothetical protein